MREIRVRDASIFANLGGKKIDFEIRTSKDSARGFSLLIDGVKLLDVTLVGDTLKDGDHFDGKPPLLKIADTVLGAGASHTEGEGVTLTVQADDREDLPMILERVQKLIQEGYTSGQEPTWSIEGGE